MNADSSGRRGCVVWITGFSGAGKSTLAKKLCSQLTEFGIRPVLIDGDEIRTALVALISASHAYERATRLDLARTYSRLCQLLARQGHTVVVATVSLFHEIHFWNRTNLPCYIEVFLDNSIEDVNLRNLIYLDRSANDSRQVVGIDLAAELPLSSDFRFTNHSLNQVDLIASTIRERVLLNSKASSEFDT